jgi:PKD repeat protein
LSVAFTDTTSGQASRWQWDFGDGSGSTLQNPTHVYSTPGRYTVVLTAIGPGGSASKTAAPSISVGGTNAIIGAVRAAVAAKVEATPPVVNFAIGGMTGTAPFSVKFTNATTYASGWKWDFGDGSTGTEYSPTHTYYLPGTYWVKLTAAGPGGTASMPAGTPITVDAAPPGVPIGTVCSSGTPPQVLVGQSGDPNDGTGDQIPAGVGTAFRTTPGGCGKVGSLSVYLDSSSNATRLILGLYSDVSGHPGSLLDQGSMSNPIAGALNTISIFPRQVNTSEVYWIAILGTQSGEVHLHTQAGGCFAEVSGESNLTALPSTWTTGVGPAACPVSAYGSSTP